MALELFAGAAGVSASFKRKGFANYVAVGKVIPKLPKATVTKLDLAKRDVQLLVLDWIASPKVPAGFMAPPCGTASVARNIEIPGEERAPKPLRSVLQPNGLDGLIGTDLLSVSLANVLYDFAAGVWDACCRYRKLCMLLESPAQPPFFHTTMWRERCFADLEVIQFHQACAYRSLIGAGGHD